MSKRAIILAGGLGTRLHPYTLTIPKPLVPIGDIPIMEIIIRKLIQNGFTHITLAVNHLADLIQAFFGNGSKWHIKIDYSLEDRPLGTMGPLRLISDLPENFLILNGDTLTDLNFVEFYNDHVKEHNLFTVYAHERELITNYGVLKTDSQNQLSGFQEKPKIPLLVSMGIYMANRDVLEYIPEGIQFGFDQLMLELLHQSKKVKVKKHSGIWFDIGRPEDYEQATEYFLSHREKFINGD